LLSGNNVTNVKYKPNRNCHYESSLNNEYIPRNNMRSICKNYLKPNWSCGLAALLEQLHRKHMTLVQIPLPPKQKKNRKETFQIFLYRRDIQSHYTWWCLVGAGWEDTGFSRRKSCVSVPAIGAEAALVLS
jgi:hypothetical protein